MTLRLWKLAAMVMSLAPMAAQGQDRSGAISAQFSGVLNAPQHRDAVLAAVRQSTTWIRHGCQSGTFKPLPSIRIWRQPTFDENNTPLDGAWSESVKASGCGITRILNAATIVRTPGVLASQVLAPGATLADPELQKDASRYVFSAGMLGQPDCHQAFIDNTTVVGQEPASSDARLIGPVKMEHWMVSACGKDITVEVKFLPQAGQTTIVAHAL